MNICFLNWSTGKDAAYALYCIQQERKYEVVRLLTTTNAAVDRVSMHGVRQELLLRQVEQLEIPIDIIALDASLTMETYEARMSEQLQLYLESDIKFSVYGDILLEDLKKFREHQLQKIGFTGVFPLWKRPTRALFIEMIEAGFKTIVVCVNTAFLDKSFLGRTLDVQFLADLPENVDPCGENGEFHTFVYDGPIFKSPVQFLRGEAVYKTYPAPRNQGEVQEADYGYWFLDLL